MSAASVALVGLKHSEIPVVKGKIVLCSKCTNGTNNELYCESCITSTVEGLRLLAESGTYEVFPY
jgi:hypothetical protein